MTTTSGAEPIGIIENQKLDVVLLDVLMPGMDGLEVLKRVRESSPVPVIVFTASPKMTETAMKMGAIGYISKPFNPDQLVETLESVLKGNQDT